MGRHFEQSSFSDTFADVFIDFPRAREDNNVKWNETDKKLYKECEVDELSIVWERHYQRKKKDTLTNTKKKKTSRKIKS